MLRPTVLVMEYVNAVRIVEASLYVYHISWKRLKDVEEAFAQT